MEFFKTRYRIVTDTYAGYEVQKSIWYCPWWIQPTINTHDSIDSAKKYIEIDKAKELKKKEKPKIVYSE